MASNRDLFGDDDSDDDDDNNDENKDVVMADASTTTTAVVAAPNTSTADTPLNDNEDDDEKQSKINISMDNKENDDDDDDDEDDDAPQFDDQDVVGTKSTKRIDTHTPSGFDSNNNNNSEELSTDKTSTTPKVIPVHPTLILPDTFSKFPSDVRKVDTVKYFTKLPNLMGIQTMGFSEETYEPDMEEELYQQAAYNLIRWRYKIDPVTKQPMRQKKNPTEHHESKEGHEKDDDDDDNDDGLSLVRESNTRLVEWEDGSHTLHIGSECFHVDFVDSSIQTTNPTNPNTTTSFPGLNGYLYLSQNATYQAPNKDNDGDNDNHPEMIPKTTKKETILQSMGSIQQRMILRPSSLQSEAHKSLTVGIRQKTIKKARIAEVVTQEDPELIKQQKMKLSQDLEKTNLRKRSSGGGGGGMYGTSRGSGYSGSSGSRPRMSKGYLEEDDDYDTTNLKDMKRRTMNRYEDDDDDDDDDMRDYGDDDDDDDDDDIATRNKGRPSRRGVVGSLANAASTKTAGGGTGSKNAKSGQAKKDDDDDDDDVFGDDDDDDEDDIQLKTKSQKKKLHQAVIDDDDDDE